MATKSESNEKLLVIVQENENSIPKVYYKGKEITGRVCIEFFWHTRTANEPNKLNIKIKYADKKTASVWTIGLNKNFDTKNFKIDVNVADALKGLKALQREARKAASEAKKLQSQTMVFYDEFHCPKCKGNNLETTTLRTFGDEEVSERRDCLDCGWSNE